MSLNVKSSDTPSLFLFRRNDWKITPALSLYNGSANSPYNIRIGDVKSANLSSLYQLAVGPQLMNR